MTRSIAELQKKEESKYRDRLGWANQDIERLGREVEEQDNQGCLDSQGNKIADHDK